MWLITPTGFFSIVQKPSDVKAGTLTIRSRVRSDLVALKSGPLPSLGPISESKSTDYRFRAQASREDVARAMTQMIETLCYDNFKSEVARRQGAARAHLYHDVWNVLYRLQGKSIYEGAEPEASPGAHDIPEADAYGGVLINDRGEVLLREPSGHFGGYTWTFAKGRPDPGETPAEAALREVLEETGQGAVILEAIPKIFPGTTSSTAFFLMSPVGEAGAFSSETVATIWVGESEARKRIGMSKSSTGRRRDLDVLEAGLAAWRARR